MGRYFWLLSLIVTMFCFNSCSKDSTVSDNTEDSNNNDTSENCNGSNSGEYSLTFGLYTNDNVPMVTLYLIDENNALIDQSQVAEGGEVTLSGPGDSQSAYTLVYRDYRSSYNYLDSYIFYNIPPGRYEMRDIPPEPNYQSTQFSFNNVGPLPVRERNWNSFFGPDYYSTQNGGTYFFGQVPTNSRRYYPIHKGYFLSLRSDNESNDRYLWTPNPPLTNNPGAFNFQNLSIVDQLIDVGLVSNNSIYYLDIFGFVPNNTHPYSGNRVGRYREYSSDDVLKYSIPSDLFNRFRYDVGISRNDGVNVFMRRFQNEPVTQIPEVNYSFQINNSDVNAFSASTNGNFDAIRSKYYVFEEEGSSYTYHYLTIYSPNKGSAVTFNAEPIIDTYLSEMTIYKLNDNGVDFSLHSYEDTECYGTFLQWNLNGEEHLKKDYSTVY